MKECKVCRICLRLDVKLYKYNQFHLDQYYKEITAVKMNSRDRLPNYFCFECASLLQKYHKFREKCLDTNSTLHDMLKKHNMITEYPTIQNQCHLLDMTKNERVKTYNIKHTKRKKMDFEIEQVYLNSDCFSWRNDCDKQFIVQEEINTVTNEFAILAEDMNSANEISKSNDINNDSDTVVFEDNISNSGTTNYDNIKTNLGTEEILCNDERDTVPKKRQITKRSGTNNKKIVENDIEKKFQSTKKRKNFIDPERWEKISLNEEEAMQMFKARSLDTNYMYATFKCMDCYKHFSQRDILDRHLEITHSLSRGKIECHFCRARFKWNTLLRRHLRRHYTKYKCLDCGKQCAEESTAYSHEQLHKGIKRRCMHCGEEFGLSSSYYTHLRTHRSSFVCALCGASFVSELGLHQHKRVKHINERPEITNEDRKDTFCEVCDMKFESKMAYDKHFVHSANHAESDSTPGAPRKTSADRKNRNARKVSKKPTTCYICDKQFETQHAYSQHHLRAHPRTALHAPAERHICEICGASLAPMSVALHMNSHTRARVYPCGACDKQFTCKSTLNRHKVTHTGEKRFACALCDKRFTQSGSAKLHHRTAHLHQPYPKRNRTKKIKCGEE